ncbi:SRPBCC domain-containing protein [Blastococcus sp. VKM Ac-2987]|uniref:SRPBCC domain-containing protein n=1 Tax=Blastococcus sp. VKM Ac-2987 TaxID=3004141 RepID=UPI0022ABBB04|nr:SRPBCC domain-containing protein [Blastococcus sp. VKM Ac-2987]MCZ2860896.1 SRPBCC domain-containing protein [Blastococcus sp. VKM Ac-2987]
MSTTRVSALLRAPRPAVYRALTDPATIARWRMPDGMTSAVETLADGGFRVTLTYEAADQRGKTTGRSDSYRARFSRLVPDELVVEVDEFETADPLLAGEMTTTITLRDAGGGTELLAVHEGVPDGVAPEDNEVGWRMALGRLAALVEA